MKKAEIIFTIIIGIALIFKLLNWPYSSIMLSISVLLLSLLYFWFGFALLNNLGLRAAFKSESYKNISMLRVFGAIGTGFVFSLLVIYKLFRIQFWPYGQIGLQQGLILLGIILAIVLVFHFMNRKQFLKDNYIRFIIIGVFSVLLYSVSSDQLVDIIHGRNPKYAEEFKEYIKDDSPNARPPIKEYDEETCN